MLIKAPLSVIEGSQGMPLSQTGAIPAGSNGTITITPHEPGNVILLKKLEVQLATNCTVSQVLFDGVDQQIKNLTDSLDLEDLYGAPYYVNEKIEVKITSTAGSASNCSVIARGLETDLL